MRFLHTSDWHLGRSFGPLSLQQDQSTFVDWFVQTAIAEAVDLVVVAGDVYDRAIPPTWALSLFRSALVRLWAAGIQVVVVTGNHDAPERVAAYDGLLDHAGVHVRGGYGRAGEVLRLGFADGPVDVVALPYLDPVLAPADAPVRATHHDVLEVAMRRAIEAGLGPRTIAVAHAFVINSTWAPRSPRVESASLPAVPVVPLGCSSERALSVGGSPAVAASVFADCAYVALGHLHIPQTVGAPTVRYSGSPLAYSFSETASKQIVLVELDAVGGATIREVPVPVGRGVITIVGPIQRLLDEPVADAVDRHVRAVLTDPGAVVDAKRRLQRVYPFVVEIELRPARASIDESPGRVAGRRLLGPDEVVAEFWRDVQGAGPDVDELALLLAGLDAVGCT